MRCLRVGLKGVGRFLAWRIRRLEGKQSWGVWVLGVGGIWKGGVIGCGDVVY